jgi:adenylate cyclase
MKPDSLMLDDDDEPVSRNRNWSTYLGITGLLLLLVVMLAGGLIWYSSKKASSFAVTAAKQLIQETENQIADRIKLLYEPMFAVVGVGSLVPEFTTPAIKEDVEARRLMLRALRIYPQILSLYVGFDSGDFFMVTHIAGVETASLRQKLRAPSDAVFAVEMVGGTSAGERQAKWRFLDKDGGEIASLDPQPTTFDPRQRPWYRPAQQSDVVEHSELYIFSSSGEPGFTVSRAFTGPTPGVIGADLAASELADFLREQRITPGSVAFIFNKQGEIIAMPDQGRIAEITSANGEATSAPPKVSEVHDPVIGGLVAAYGGHQMTGARVYKVAGRTYIGQVTEIPPRYGLDQLLAIMVPINEIEQPILGIRNETLLYSIAFLVFALPLYVTLIVAWIDRRLQAPR